MQLWFSHDPGQMALPADLQNIIQLSGAFWSELKEHPIPVDLNAVKCRVG
jgi:hypothetical protein